MFFKTTTMMVERLAKVGESDTGTPIMDWVTIYPSVDADFQANQSELDVVVSGQTSMSHQLVFCDMLNIIEGDKITDLFTDIPHKVLSVNNNKILSHMELNADSGVF